MPSSSHGRRSMMKITTVEANIFFAELSSTCVGTRRHMVDCGDFGGRLEWMFAPV